MSEDLICLIAFILGWLASRMMGNGFSVDATGIMCDGESPGYCAQETGNNMSTCDSVCTGGHPRFWGIPNIFSCNKYQMLCSD